MEDKKRNPILKYIGKPKISSQSSEYQDLLGCSTHQPPCCLEETCSHLRAQGRRVAFVTRGTAAHPVAGTLHRPPSALLQPLTGNLLSQLSVLPCGFEGSGKGAEPSSPPKFTFCTPSCRLTGCSPCITSATAPWGGAEQVCTCMCVHVYTCVHTCVRLCSSSSPSALSSHVVSSHVPSLPPPLLNCGIDLTSHFCFSFQHFMSLCPLLKVKGLFFCLPFTSCAYFYFVPPQSTPALLHWALGWAGMGAVGSGRRAARGGRLFPSHAGASRAPAQHICPRKLAASLGEVPWVSGRDATGTFASAARAGWGSAGQTAEVVVLRGGRQHQHLPPSPTQPGLTWLFLPRFCPSSQTWQCEEHHPAL